MEHIPYQSNHQCSCITVHSDHSGQWLQVYLHPHPPRNLKVHRQSEMRAVGVLLLAPLFFFEYVISSFVLSLWKVYAPAGARALMGIGMIGTWSVVAFVVIVVGGGVSVCVSLYATFLSHSHHPIS